MGHFLRVWTERSGPAIGCDLVFSNLWLARRFVAPKADMVCCDLDFRSPVQSDAAEICFAQDAFHYFRKKPHAFKEMKRISSRGIVLLGHVHNATQPNLSPGCPLKLHEYAECIRPAVTYRDKDLTAAALTGVPAQPVESAAELSAARAFSFATNKPIESIQPWLTTPRPGLPLQLNPLLVSGTPHWPSAKFKSEFVDEWSYLLEMTCPSNDVIAAAQAGQPCEVHARRQGTPRSSSEVDMTPFTGIPPKRSRIWPEDSTWGGMLVYCREAWYVSSPALPRFSVTSRVVMRCVASRSFGSETAQMIPLPDPMMSRISAMACSSIGPGLNPFTSRRVQSAFLYPAGVWCCKNQFRRSSRCTTLLSNPRTTASRIASSTRIVLLACCFSHTVAF